MTLNFYKHAKSHFSNVKVECLKRLFSKNFLLFCISYFIVKIVLKIKEFKNKSTFIPTSYIVISYLRTINYKAFDNFVLLIFYFVKSKFAYYINNPNFRGPDLDPNSTS